MRNLRRTVSVVVLMLLLAVLLGACKSKPISEQERQPSRKSILWAAMAGNLDLLKSLEAKGASLDFQDPRVFNWSPLTAAIYHKQTSIIAYLLSRNVNLNLQDRDGQTSLMWAIRVNDTNTVRLLLQKGADTTIKDNGGITAMGYAEANDNREILLDWLNQYKPDTK